MEPKRNAALVSLHDPFDFRFGTFVRELNYERNKTLTYKDLAGTETETPYEPEAFVLKHRNGSQKSSEGNNNHL